MLIIIQILVSFFVQITFIVANYRKWIKDIDELQSTRVTMPILSDPDCKVLSQVCKTSYCYIYVDLFYAIFDSFLVGLCSNCSRWTCKCCGQWYLPY